MEQYRFDIVIIGGGCVGLATAWKINNQFPHLKIAILEKEHRVAAHQTGHNSGVIHSGIYYKPGSYKARNCVEGRRELVTFAKEHGVKHDVCGKIIVATKESELAHMHKVFQHGQANGVEDIRMITAAEIREIEPWCTGIAGIWVGCTGIIDYAGFCEKLAELLTRRFENSRIFLSTEAKTFTNTGAYTLIHTNRQHFEARYVIACAGLQSDRLAKKEGTGTKNAIVGFRGDYYDLSEQGRMKVRNLIYPVPNPQFPFLGVHFTRMTDGSVECGPNAVFVFDREGYGKTDFNLKDTAEALSYGGTWKFFARHWRFGLDEYKGAFSKQFFLKRLQQLIPSLSPDDIVPGRAGVRAMALSPDGKMIDDFSIAARGNAIHVLNAPSPAATAALAIGQAIMEMAEKQFDIHPN